MRFALTRRSLLLHRLLTRASSQSECPSYCPLPCLESSLLALNQEDGATEVFWQITDACSPDRQAALRCGARSKLRNNGRFRLRVDALGTDPPSLRERIVDLNCVLVR